MTRLRLAIFDVDGTLVDSQLAILSCMAQAFAAVDRPVPSDDAVRGIVGLSLPVAVAQLAPDVPEVVQDQIVATYKDAYANQRAAEGARNAPLYPGALDCLAQLEQDDHVLLAVATGKSRRGLDHLFALHGLEGRFLSTQVADDHPSKPHPSMIHRILRDTGVDANQAVMIGDTSFDMDMGAAAGVKRLGVSWGYHSVARLEAAGAQAVAHRFDEVAPLLEHLWGFEHV